MRRPRGHVVGATKSGYIAYGGDGRTGWTWTAEYLLPGWVDTTVTDPYDTKAEALAAAWAAIEATQEWRLYRADQEYRAAKQAHAAATRRLAKAEKALAAVADEPRKQRAELAAFGREVLKALPEGHPYRVAAEQREVEKAKKGAA